MPSCGLAAINGAIAWACSSSLGFEIMTLGRNSLRSTGGGSAVDCAEQWKLIIIRIKCHRERKWANRGEGGCVWGMAALRGWWNKRCEGG